VSKPTKNSKRFSNRRKPKSDAGAATHDGAEPVDDADSTQNESAKVKSKDIQGLKYFDMLLPLLERLHGEQCGRDKAKNRQLHFDKYCMLVLLYMFNPTVTSLRAMVQASELERVQKKLGCKRTSLGAFSEASRLFDPEPLKEIIAELGLQAAPVGRDKRLSQINQTITLVDGSIVSALPDLIQASLLKQTQGSGLVQWRLHTHFEVDRYVPTRIDVTPNGGGEDDERAVAERTIEADHLYVMDRGYAKFGLFNAIVDKQSSYVCRLRDNSVYEVIERRELSVAAIAADVLHDEIVSMGGASKNSAKPDHRIRLIQIRCTPHRNRTGGKALGSKAPDSDGVLRIATNLLDLPLIHI